MNKETYKAVFTQNDLTVTGLCFVDNLSAQIVAIMKTGGFVDGPKGLVVVGDSDPSQLLKGILHTDATPTHDDGRHYHVNTDDLDKFIGHVILKRPNNKITHFKLGVVHNCLNIVAVECQIVARQEVTQRLGSFVIVENQPII